MSFLIGWRRTKTYRFDFQKKYKNLPIFYILIPCLCLTPGMFFRTSYRTLEPFLSKSPFLPLFSVWRPMTPCIFITSWFRRESTVGRYSVLEAPLFSPPSSNDQHVYLLSTRNGLCLSFFVVLSSYFYVLSLRYWLAPREYPFFLWSRSCICSFLWMKTPLSFRPFPPTSVCRFRRRYIHSL